MNELETNSNLSDSAISLSTSAIVPANNLSAMSELSLSQFNATDFDKILQRIRSTVDKKLSIETNNHTRLNSNPNMNEDSQISPVKSTTFNRRQQLLALHAVSCQEKYSDDYDADLSLSTPRRNQLDPSSKSQSFDTSDLSKSRDLN